MCLNLEKRAGVVRVMYDNRNKYIFPSWKQSFCHREIWESKEWSSNRSLWRLAFSTCILEEHHISTNYPKSVQAFWQSHWPFREIPLKRISISLDVLVGNGEPSGVPFNVISCILPSSHNVAGLLLSLDCRGRSRGISSRGKLGFDSVERGEC
jgi:hypothetical protein